MEKFSYLWSLITEDCRCEREISQEFHCEECIYEDKEVFDI